MRIRKTTLFVVVALVAIVVGSLTIYAIGIGTRVASTTSPTGSTSTSSYPPYTNLPSGCVKPAKGFLVIADINGFNDSIQHGAPATHWPVITVKQGTTVTITVCNADHQAHGFQVAHYFDSNVETIDPGQVVHISFVANEAGDFEIYCSIFCSIHIYMQNALLHVTP